MSIASEISADLVGIIGENPVTFAYASVNYTGYVSFARGDTTAMLPQGYDPEIDEQLIVRITALGAANPQVREFVTIAGLDYRIIRADRNPAFLLLGLKRNQ